MPPEHSDPERQLPVREASMPEQVRDLRRRDRLGWRLMRITLLLACAIGMVLNIGQILVDSRSQGAEIDRSVQRLLAIMREPATEAVYNIDDRLARRVLEGVFRYEGVLGAELVVGEDELLARDTRAPVAGPFRFVTAALFGDRRDYRIDLLAESGERVGSLRLQLDTYPPGRAFLMRAGVVLALGMLNAGLLALLLLTVFHRFLTRPLVRMVHGLSSFDPNTPESKHLDVPAGHEADELGLWARSVNRLLAAIRETLARRTEAETRASWLEQFDTLTGLANRALLLASTTNAMASAGPDGRLAVVIVDIREFRDINAQYGVEYGDQVLREAAHRLNFIAAGGTVLVARLAEDAFAFLMAGADVRERAEELARDLKTAFAAALGVGPHLLNLGIDIGIAVYPEDADSADRLIQNAERALAFAKKMQIGVGQFYEAQHDKELQMRKRLTRDLRVAPQHDEIRLHYQPLVDAHDGHVAAVEVLARWAHPEFGSVPPVEFVALAESSGQIIALGEWVLRRACQDAAAWRRISNAPPRVAVNVSATQLRERGFDRIVESALTDARLPPALLELEITETALIENIDQAIGILQRLRATGVRISIDDFGTGLASLSYLKRLPIDQLKIDISFIRDVLHDPGDAQIVKAIINLGHSLDLEVVAEGVEAPAQRDFLAANGCDLMQGFLFASPMDPVAFLNYLQRQAPARSVVVPISGGRSAG
jgi:diguanylate cyclase (GGDEF)-like protein